MEYNFRDIEQKWQKYWAENQTFKAHNPGNSSPVFGRGVGGEAKKFYVLDMFPYPSGAGLHVGHPLGYIASDIVARYKRLKGYNVLHPMGYDSFGLPAEQYAIQTGQHPAVTTEANIKRFREQLDKMGFSFDWSREVKTSDPGFYKWTQWIFLQLFNSWYNPETDKAEAIDGLIKQFTIHNSKFTIDGKEKNWNGLNEKEKSELLMNYRLAYLDEAYVNWCPALGTVLANDEVKDGVSERGGFPVERKLMLQWSLRITAYAERLLNDLEKIDWSESIKESQRNWIGKSEGCSIRFRLMGLGEANYIEVFTTRPDTVYGATFMALAPENELAERITSPEYKKAAEEYIHYAKNRSERERQADVKKVTGQFTGAYAEHPFTGEKIPVWVAEYVLAAYGTGAVMGVPAHDMRDFAFAKHFKLPVNKVIQPNDKALDEQECFDTYDGYLINSDLINNLQVKDAIKKIIREIEKRGLGKRQVNYRLRDAIFGRQRYWGEPIPIYYKDGIPNPVDEKYLPVLLPEIDKYLPTETGEPPLARASNWKHTPDPSLEEKSYPLETTTMPGWAGSSWYYLRYMDAQNEKEFASKDAINYWNDIDLYIGGAEHATGHLLYVRFWTKFLYDLGLIPITEPAKKLVNQGMIQGRSLKPCMVADNYLGDDKLYYSLDFIQKKCSEANIEYSLGFNFPIEYADENDLIFKDTLKELHLREPYFKDVFSFDLIKWEKDKNNLEYIKLDSEVEKMSKSKRNVVNPDDIIEKYGADAFRMYEMFLGPLELSKPWNTNGITGVFNFLKKFWRLFFNPQRFSDDEPAKEELKILHRTLKKVSDDIERLSFNTAVSSFMICVNELTDLKCSKRKILEPLVIALSPFAPHVAEELWQELGHNETVTYQKFPEWKDEYVKEDEFEYPVSINGKTRFKINLSLAMSTDEVQKAVLSSEDVKKYLNGNAPKKVIVVHGRIVNIVV